MSENNQHITDDVLVKYMLDEASAAEIQQVNKWVSLNAENRRYYEQFMIIWKESSHLSPAQVPDVNEAWLRLQQRIKGQGKIGAKVFLIFGVPVMRIAAIFILAMAVTVVAILLNRVGEKTITLASGNKVLSDTLPDGSIITLNKNSTLSYVNHFRSNQRGVSLHGEAFFNVSPDKEKPFTISTPEANIVVTGTSFNVNSRTATTTVVVETGSVRVSNAKQAVNLKPGEQVSIGKSDTVFRKRVRADLLYNYYRTKVFKCSNTPLYRLADKLDEAYNVHIVFGNDAIRNFPLNTTFDNEPLENILNIICTTFSLHWKRTGDTILIN